MSDGGSRSGGKRAGGAVTAEQKSKMDRWSQKLKVGDRGIYDMGGDYSVITKPISFKREKNGDVSYSVTGERYMAPEKSATIGVGNLPARLRTVTSTGVIKPNGVWVKNKNISKEEVVKKR